MRIPALLVALAGCSFTPGSLTDRDDGGLSSADASDGGGSGTIDAAPDALGCTTTFSKQLPTCSLAAPTAPPALSAGNNTYDTGTGMLTTSSGTTAVPHTTVMIGGVLVDVWHVTELTIPGGTILDVRGPNPFAIITPGALTIAGILDASSTTSARGAGARDAGACGTSKGTNGMPNAGGASGAGGGALSEVGGNGGLGDSNGDNTPGSPGGTKVTFDGTLLGGCPGGTGGSGDVAGGLGGLGGGAIDLIAGGAITISGFVLAGGVGGLKGGADSGGGGGGGSGGTILVEASIVTLSGFLLANGGGGGGGAGTSSGTDGQSAQLSTSRALGGAAGSFGSNGGQGGALSVRSGETVTSEPLGGGGGGGGAAGFIAIDAGTQQISGATSPALTAW